MISLLKMELTRTFLIQLCTTKEQHQQFLASQILILKMSISTGPTKNLSKSMEVYIRVSLNLSCVQFLFRLMKIMTYNKPFRLTPMTNSCSSQASATMMNRATCLFKRKMEQATTRDIAKTLQKRLSLLEQCWRTKTLYYSLLMMALSVSQTYEVSLQQKMIFSRIQLSLRNKQRLQSG